MSTRKAAALRRPVLIVLVSVPVSACIESTVVPESATLGIATNADSIASDGLASVVVTAELPQSLPEVTSVEFTTTLGRWANPGGPPDRKVTVQARGRVAEAHLFTFGEVGTAYVAASTAGLTARTTVELTPSFPEMIDLFVDRTAAPADGATAVTATAVLRRGAGTASRGIPVRFEVRDSATQALLPELSGVVVADSAASARFRFTSTLPRTVLLRAVAATVESDARTVRFNPPPAVARQVQSPLVSSCRAASHLLICWRKNE
jgi:hypothetical protein